MKNHEVFKTENMVNIMHICVVSPDFPTSKTNSFIFVDQICKAFADYGLRVTIISPQSLTKCWIHKIPIYSFHTILKTKKGNVIDLYRPKTITLGSLGLKYKLLGKYNDLAFNMAVKFTYKKNSIRHDIIYGHFWNAVYSLYPIAKKYSIPLFASSGEEFVSIQHSLSNLKLVKFKHFVRGVINVSTKNMNECVKAGLCAPSDCIVIPNGVDTNLFFKKKKDVLRKQFGYDDDMFIVAFVGQFIERKGSLRLSKALEMLDDNNIYAIFLGSGPEVPTYKRTLLAENVPHNDLPDYLNCADIFVLPTLNEGCSNAIIEAMACGLPIISSDRPFNHDILNDDNSIMIDPNDINSIALSIKYLKDNKDVSKEMSIASIEMAKELTLDKRAKKIITFINSRI